MACLILCLHLKPLDKAREGQGQSNMLAYLVSPAYCSQDWLSQTLPGFCASSPLFILSLILAFPLRPEKIFPTLPGPAMALEMLSHLPLGEQALEMLSYLPLREQVPLAARKAADI